jgi:hypothetical protein
LEEPIIDYIEQHAIAFLILAADGAAKNVDADARLADRLLRFCPCDITMGLSDL